MSHLKISTRLIILISLLSMMLISMGTLGLVGIKLTQDEAKNAKKLQEDHALFVQEGLRPAVTALRADDAATAHRYAWIKLQLDVAQAEYNATVARYVAPSRVALAPSTPSPTQNNTEWESV